MEIVWLKSAIKDLERLQQFVLLHNPKASQEIALKIFKIINHLKTNPALGKPVDDPTGFRDIAIPFGIRGYLLRYRIFDDLIYIVHIRHARENKFH